MRERPELVNHPITVERPVAAGWFRGDDPT